MFDDKELGIVCGTLIAIVAMIAIPEAAVPIVTGIVGGIFGVAIGKKL
jgi:hypothetical protein